MNITWRSQWTTPSLAGVVGFGIGVGVGYALCSRRKSSITTRVVEKDGEYIFHRVEEPRVIDHVDPIAVSLDPTADNETSVREVKDEGEEFAHFLIERNGEVIQLVSTDVDTDQPEPGRVSVFSDGGDDPEWDYEAELAKRTGMDPYVLHKDEYFNDEKGYTQSTLTYYAGDDVLVDEQDVPIYDRSKIAGDLEFGKGSGDPNAVYVRNEALEAEYEIIRDTGHYTIEVLGASMEEELSTDKPVIHRMRQD